MGGEYIDIPFKASDALKALPKPKKQTTKKDKNEMDKEKFKKVEAGHRAEIAKLKNDIKKHKLLIKQAKIVYKLESMKEKKS